MKHNIKILRRRHTVQSSWFFTQWYIHGWSIWLCFVKTSLIRIINFTAISECHHLRKNYNRLAENRWSDMLYCIRSLPRSYLFNYIYYRFRIFYGYLHFYWHIKCSVTSISQTDKRLSYVPWLTYNSIIHIRINENTYVCDYN